MEMPGNTKFYAQTHLRMHLKALGDLLSNAERILETFWEKPKRYWRRSDKA
jgi:hypothetical protein